MAWAKASVATSTRTAGTVDGTLDCSKTSPTRANTSASRANQPQVSNIGANGHTPASEMRPCVGRSPYTPQKLAGARTDPPVSLPMAKSTSAPATAAADPLDDPPGTRSGAAGLMGVP